MRKIGKRDMFSSEQFLSFYTSNKYPIPSKNSRSKVAPFQIYGHVLTQGEAISVKIS